MVLTAENTTAVILRKRDLMSTLPERLWSTRETAAFLGLPESTLHQLTYKGTGPRSYKVGRHRRYNPADVAVWLGRRASAPAA